MGRWLITIGVIFLVAGLLVMLGERAGIKLGRLPGDIVLRGRNSTFYFPVVTCILISVVLTILSWLFQKR